MNTDLQQELEGLADMPRIWKRMDAVEAKKKADRRLLILLLIAGLVVFVGAFCLFNDLLPY